MATLALVLRLLVIAGTPHFKPDSDAVDYDRIAVSLVRSGSFPRSAVVVDPEGGPTALRPPLFPLALAAVYRAVGVGSASTRWTAARVFEALLGAVTVVLVALVALRLWAPRIALLSAAIAAVYPPLILIGSSILSESLFTPLALAGVLSALAYRNSSRLRWAVVTGALLGLAALTRSIGIFLLLPLGALIWIGRPRWSWPALRAPAACLAATILVILPWTIRNAVVFHEFVPVSTETGLAIAGTYNHTAQTSTDYPAFWIMPEQRILAAVSSGRKLNEAQISSRLTHDGLKYIDAHPTSVAKTAYWTTLRLLNLTGAGLERVLARPEAYPPSLAVASVYAFWLLAALGLGGIVTAGARRAPLALWACPVMIVLPSVFILGTTRYRAPADPFVILLAAVGLSAAWQRLREVRPLRAARANI